MSESEQNGTEEDSHSSSSDDSSDSDIDVDRSTSGTRHRLLLRLIEGAQDLRFRSARDRRRAEELILNLLRQRNISANFEYINQFNSENEPELENKTLTDQSAVEFMHRLKSRLSHASQPNSFVHKMRRRIIHQRRRSHMQYLASELLPEKFLGHLKLGRRVFCGIFSNDGRSFVTATQDHVIRIINVDKIDEGGIGKPVPLNSRATDLIRKRISIRDGGWSILDLALAPGSDTGVIAGWGEAIHLFYLNPDRLDTTPIPLPIGNTYEEHGYVHSAIFSCAYAPDGSKIVGGSRSGILYQFDLHRAESTCHMANRKEEDVNAICFSAENPNLVFSGGDDGILTCWDSRLFGSPDSPVGYLAGHSEGITHIDSSCDGYTLLSNSKDQTIKIWDVRNFSDERSAMEIQSEICGTNNRMDYRYSEPEDFNFGRVIERKPNDSSLMTLGGHAVKQTLIRARFSPESTGSRYVYSGDSNYGYCVWDLFSGKMVVKNDCFHRMIVRDAHWHPYRPIIATSSWDETVAFWKAVSFKDDSDLESRSTNPDLDEKSEQVQNSSSVQNN